ncbi:MAG: SEL1-like repeat protein [Rhodospirillales bacterium]|nr:SEL1-like repeat protein [Rhodospirillales bacterium]
MIEKIAKYLILSILGLCALTFVAVLVIDDETIENTTGGAAETLLGIKHGVYDTVSSKSESFIYWVRTSIHEVLNFSPTDRTPRVVMRIPPPPEDIRRAPASSEERRSAPETEVEPVPTHTESAAAEAPAAKPTPDNAVAPMPESQVPATAMTENTEPAMTQPPGTAEPLTTSPAPPVEEVKSALGYGQVAQEGAPDAQPVENVSEQPLSAPQTEQAALPPGTDVPAADAPPPPPVVEEARPGEADYQQGLRFYNGDGVEQNFGKAAQHFLKAAEAGHVGAQYNLGIMNYTGQTGGQDFANAAKWFERAASAGHTQAQYNLGFLYYEGKGVAQDLKTAFDWINRAAEEGYPKAIKARDAFKQAMPEMFTKDKAQAPAN